MAFHFKLSKPGGLTRRVGYATQPAWTTLATRINELFHIPVDQIGVSYIDADGDEVTLSSENELQDFYLAAREKTFKFNVLDLSRDDEKSLPDIPRTGLRNTFGDIDTDEGWDSLGGIFVPGMNIGPHAFIQTVDSEVTSQHDSESDHSTTDFGPILDKGKAKAVDPSPAPTSSSKRQQARHPSLMFDRPQNLWKNPSDPPVPTLESHNPPSASLPNDVASLLTTLTNVMSSHPELAEGLRNIVSNATNGAYWNSHRANFSQAAGEFVQSAGQATNDLRRQAEDEAGRRVAHALEGMFRSFSQAMAAPTVNATGEQAESTTGVATEDSEQPWRTSTPTTDPVNSTSFWYAPPMWGGMRGGAPRRGRSPNPWAALHLARDGVPPPPPPPPPPPHGPPPMPFMAPWGHWGRGNVPQPPQPPPQPAAPPTSQPAAAQATSPKPTPQELRAQVDAAKLAYKREKERYRAEREERRKVREARTRAAETKPATTTENDKPPTEKPAPVQETTPEPVLVSTGNAKVGYPQLEMYSVPHRHNTYHGQPSRRRVPESASERSVNRITKRLAAMGITENAHPTLPAKIKEQLPEGNVSDEAEQNIVSTLVEELVFMSPKPTASGSRQNADVPGTWL
ncbi:F-box domain-containing protein [Mycena indigotica]|uniref:F-box domain-containing protein n=1 Tax=Mycena indigotica TaxID=2126181 RepID=A0A8H6SXP9_9AGAR|nr:F-box domain-containing protein [Mycena indigotica]KAF7307050.1 F-box domain-containing protein [Mycena indigotica]